MKFCLTTFVLLLASLLAAHDDEPAAPTLQFCAVDIAQKTDLCFALTSTQNITTQAKDLSLHLSVNFFTEQIGWAAVGVGEKMSGALMFVLYPGFDDGGTSSSFLSVLKFIIRMQGESKRADEGKTVTVSIRSTTDHISPTALISEKPDIHVTRAWVDDHGLYNAQLVCYDCESWGESRLDVRGANQSWIWSTNSRQRTRSGDIGLQLVTHTDHGIAYLDMASAYSENGVLAIAEVSHKRISNEPKKQHHTHSAFGIVSIHGFLLSTAFFMLSVGVLAIRSGLAKSFKFHWLIQAAAAGIIILGCVLGIILSFSHGSHFSTIHQIMGLLVAPTIILQSLFGYWHHVDFVKSGRRTVVSAYHVWLGRILILLGNVNVGFGLRLSHGSSTKYMFWLTSVFVQLAVLIPTWYFWSKGKRILDVFGSKNNSSEGEEYERVEQEAFLVGDDDEFELDEECDKKEDLEAK